MRNIKHTDKDRHIHTRKAHRKVDTDTQEPGLYSTQVECYLQRLKSWRYPTEATL
jgi:hypothetical protein